MITFLQYQVMMFPPEVTGFISDPGSKLQGIPVEICTTYADGPRPIAYSPPKHSDIVRVEEGPEMGNIDPMSISELVSNVVGH